ncbi:hypothetical protein FQZ97_987600 [compost metagenome]
MPPWSSGYRLWQTICAATSTKLVTVSRSQNENTVSRCMAARDCGIWQATTRCTAPAANRAFASCPTACGVLRSPMPIKTTPLPIGMMSPPSSVAGPWSTSGSPHHTGKPACANSGWCRYTAAVSSVSCRRAGQCMGLRVTPPPIQALVSRVNSMLGSGGSTKPSAPR